VYVLSEAGILNVYVREVPSDTFSSPSYQPSQA